MTDIVPIATAETATDFAFDAIHPRSAWQLVQSGQAVLVDVRTPEEIKFVGHVPGSLNVPWATGTSLTVNPRFARELEAKVRNKQQRVLLLCRSGKRSALALQVARRAGFACIANISEGFEGDLDGQQQRGRVNGWRFYGLPWVQD